MRKKMYWGIASLILIIGVVGVYFMLQPDPEPETRYKLPTEAELENAREARKPPPNASPNGHWHGDEWHDAPHTNRPEQAGLPTDVVEVETEAERKKRLKFWADLGVDPPPPGHSYEFDEDGTPKLFKYNEPRITVRWSKDEAPGQDMNKLSFSDWQRYNVLGSIVSGDAWRLENHQIRAVLIDGEPWPKIEYAPGVQELAAEWKSEIRKKASARLPSLSTSITWDHEPTPEEVAEVDRQTKELLRSLMPKKRTDNAQLTQALFDSIVRELEAELQRR